MWVVTLVKKGNKHDFREGFFPRKVYYKADAIRLKAEIEYKGGEAYIEKAPRK